MTRIRREIIMDVQVQGLIRRTRTLIGGSCHKYNFCRDKHKTRLLSRQKYACRGNFVATKVLSRQARVLSRKTCFVAKNTCLSRQKYACCYKTVVATKLCLLRQKYACCYKTVVATKLCLLRQNFWPGKNDTCGSSRQ